MSRTITLLLTLALVVAATGAWAGTTIYGLTGLIETPDDQVAAPSAISMSGKGIADFKDSSISFFSYGGTIGVLPKLEVGAVGLERTPGGDTQALLNVKFRVMDETVTRPSVAVGVVDLTSNLKDFAWGVDDPSAFVVVGRNLASVAESFGGVVSKPLRGTLGLGTGLYRGLFAGLNWSVTNKVDLMAEYLAKGLRNDSTVSAGVRVHAMGGLSLEAGAFGFKDFYGGANFTISTY